MPKIASRLPEGRRDNEGFPYCFKEEHSPNTILISDFQPPKLGDNTFLLFLRCKVTAAVDTTTPGKFYITEGKAFANNLVIKSDPMLLVGVTFSVYILSRSKQSRSSENARNIMIFIFQLLNEDLRGQRKRICPWFKRK